jgi:hypothetical protein
MATTIAAEGDDGYAVTALIDTPVVAADLRISD